MNRTQLRRMLAVVARLVVMATLLRVPSTTDAQNGLQGNSRTGQAKDEFREIIIQGIQFGRWNLPDDSLADIQWIDNLEPWAVAFVYFLDSDTEIPLQLAPGIIPGRHVKDEWVAFFPGEPGYESAINQLPSTLLPRSFLASSGVQQEGLSPQGARNAGKLPWACDAWKPVTQDRQNSGDSHYPGGPDEWAWDFGLSTDVAVHVSRSGVVAHIYTGTPKNTGCRGCDWTKANRVVIDHEDGTATLYMHLSDQTPPISERQRISAGQVIGYADNTGNSGGTHLHFALQPWNSSWNGNVTGTLWYQHSIESLFDDPNVPGGNPTWPNSYKSGNCGGSPPPPPPPPICPTSGGIILYKHEGANEQACGGEGDGYGYVLRNSPGFYDIPSISGAFNDQASSVKVPSGWSVKLYENSISDPRGLGGWTCRSANDDNFWGDKFNNGVDLNDKVSSFEVFGDSNCGQPTNRPPNAPGLVSPENNHTARVNAPNLCWSNSTDPDGDVVSFKVEVRGDGSADSDWMTAPDPSCWTPSSLNGQYGNYNWKVRAKDSKNPPGESESGVWNFSIQPPPNYPPTISFLTANGNGDSQITSHDRNWTFAGTAADPENELSRIEFRCDSDKCDNRGSGPDQTTGTSWSLTRIDMAGQNDVYFVAYDSANQSTASRHLDLRIDLAAPGTTIKLNNKECPYYQDCSALFTGWYREPVQVRLQARDDASVGNTGRAFSGVREIHYRCSGMGCPNNGIWQTVGGSDVAFTVSDGTYTVDCYAVDNVGNQEGSRTVNFQVDQTPPTPPSGVVETHGVVSGQWQKAYNTPSFTWVESTDPSPGSGLWGYQFYFGTDPNGANYESVSAANPRQWPLQPINVRTGTYYLRGRTADLAGNWSAWTDLFTFRYDGTPPENPSGVTHAAGITNDTWQRITNLADFTWQAPHDEGSGVKDYAVYWGTDPAGTSAALISNTQYQSPTPLCGTNEACTGYLRLRSRDNVDNDAEDWTTAFILRYDNAPPVADFTFREGMTTTQTLVNLRITATDAGSGVQTMRFSGDGRNWTTWEVYTTTRVWAIPGISRQSWPIYLQVRDGVELPSEVVSHTIYLDVNPQQPRSAGFRLFDYALSAGSGAYTSTAYAGRGTLGQVMDSPTISNTQYLLRGGYEAGSQAIPTVIPGHDEFTFVNGIFASGNGSQPMTSTLYALRGVLGEPGLPNNETVLVSQSHRHQPGFLAAGLPVATPTPTPTPGPTPTPTPTPACEFPRVSINNGALFTNSPNVTLNLCAPWATEMMLSNDGGFGDAQWEPYAETKPWTITTYGQYVLPRFVYAAFKEANGTIHATYFDDIIYDPNPPVGEIAVGDGFASVIARSILSGARCFLAGGVEGRDEAISPTEGTDCFAQTARSEASLWDNDATPGTTIISIGPMKYVQRLNGVTLARPVALLAPRDDGAVDIYVNASDDNSGLAEMQISASGTFTDTAWEPYSALRPYTPEGGDGIKMVYARFKDAAGNVSAPADAQFALDTMPPLGGIALARRVVGPDTITTTVYFGAEDNLSGVVNLRVAECQTPSACVPTDALADAAWRPYTVTLTWPISLAGQTGGALYVQYRDLAGNVSEVYSDTYTVDTEPPVLYVEVAAGETLTRTVYVYAYDGMVGEGAGLATMHLTNDPLFVEGVVMLPYSETVTWAFDDRRVVWVQLSDSVGNWTEPYPAYAAPAAVAPEIAIARDAAGVLLTWTHAVTNTGYEVWRGVEPYFDPDAPLADTVRLAVVPAPATDGVTVVYTDTTALPGVSYYYLARGVNGVSQVSAASNRVGVFHFAIEPGTAGQMRDIPPMPAPPPDTRRYYLPVLTR